MGVVYKPRRLWVRLLLLGAFLFLLVSRYSGWWDAAEAPPISDQTAGNTTVEEAFGQKRSGIVVEIGGRVDRLLRDDNEGSRHQRFILELASGHTVLVSHNIDLAERVPVEPGDQIDLRGQYEWNQQGGVIHWTHHDPKGRRPGGWIEVDGRRFR